jgi:hypothetical protein
LRAVLLARLQATCHLATTLSRLQATNSCTLPAGFPPFWGSSDQIIFHRILTKPVVSQGCVPPFKTSCLQPLLVLMLAPPLLLPRHYECLPFACLSVRALPICP